MDGQRNGHDALLETGVQVTGSVNNHSWIAMPSSKTCNKLLWCGLDLITYITHVVEIERDDDDALALYDASLQLLKWPQPSEKAT